MHINHRQVYLMVKQALRKGDDETLTKDVERHRKEGFGWRYGGLSAWSTDTIFAKLQALGVYTDEQRFREQAQAAKRARVLQRTCCEGAPDTGTFWDDFPFLAVEELWRRLTPDLLCPELLADRLEEAVCASSEPPTRSPEDGQRDVETALLLMDYLERVPPEERAARQQEVEECGVCYHGSWLLCFVLNHGTRYPDEVARVADVMSSFDDAANYQGDLAFALARADRREQALDRVRANLKRFPEDFWVRIKAGDVYAELGDNEAALALHIHALGMAAESYDWDGAAERIIDLLGKMGRSDDWRELERKHPRSGRHVDVPPRHVLPPPKVITDRSEFSPQAQKVGRNDPCPCGSGRKYKKCCLERA